MFPGGIRHGLKQDLFSESSDEQQLFTEGQETSSPAEQNVFPGTENPCIVKHGETLPEGLVSHNIVQEILSGNRDTQHVVQEILTGECLPLYMDENLFSKEPNTEQNLSSNSKANQNVFPDSQISHYATDRAFSDDFNIPPDNFLDKTNDQGERTHENYVRSIVEGGFGKQENSAHVQFNGRENLPVQQAVVLPRNQMDQEDIFSRESRREQEISRESRIPQRLDIRPLPRQLDMELDLDYLERRGEHARAARGPPPEAEASPDSMDLVKVILLGAPAVGKTSIIQQFVWNDFSEEYVPTDRKHTYYPSVIINEHLYELKISDIPVIPYFPVNSYYEWTDYRFYGLRSATAYVLVFDLSNADTFQYIRTLRDQMLESRDMRNVPLLVVGNKQDLIVSSSATGGAASGNGGAGSSGASGSGGATVAIAGSSSGGAGGKDVEYREKRRDIVNLVKKHWKCSYVECSAKYNWRVVAVFKELMKAVDSLETGQTNKEVCSPMMDNIHDALDRNKCIIL